MQGSVTRKPSFAVVGAGIVGAAVARELTLRFPGSPVTVLEKEDRPAAHQTGHNSGVVHAGLYYEPGGLKAILCRRGVTLLRDFCAERDLPYQECGKVVIALDAAQQERLTALHARAVANGVPDVEMLGPDGIRSIEPHAVGRAALHSPHTAIVDFTPVTHALLDDVTAAGGVLRLGAQVTAIRDTPGGAAVVSTAGEDVVDLVITCAGLQSDRLAQRCGGPADPRIVPFFGQYLALEPAYRSQVNGLIYPVPDPRYPFLGVHLTKRIDGEVLVGPNAFLSLSRERYAGLGLSGRDLAQVLGHRGFWRFAARNYPTALREIRTVVSRKKFMREAGQYVPALAAAEATPVPRGIRAQAMTRDGELLDDFVIHHRPRITDVRNAPSPGATSSMAIAEHIVRAVTEAHDLRTP